MPDRLMLDNDAFRVGMLTARLQLMGASIEIALDDLRCGCPELARSGLDRVLRSIKASLDEIEDARRTALRRLIETEGEA